MITTFYPPYSFGGDATYVRALARALVERGHHVEVIASTDAFRLRGQPANVALDDGADGVIVHRLDSTISSLAALAVQQTGSLGFYARALRRLLKQPFDVLHFHNVSLIGGLGVLKLGSAPVRLYSLHEHWLICATHILWKNDSKVCDTKTCLRCSLVSKIPPQLWRYTGKRNASLSHIDRMLSPSEFTAAKHRDDGVATPIHLLPLFSALTTMPVGAACIEHPLFLFVGRLTEPKGIRQFLRVASALPEFSFVVIGDGELRTELERAYRMSVNISFLGHLSQPKLVAHYGSATALILPSIAPETFGLGIVEAAQCGTPAIVNRGSGGAAEIIDVTGGGLLYEGDAELTATIRLVAQDKACRDRLAAKAKASYCERYTRDRHVDAYLGQVEAVRANKLAGKLTT